MSIKLAQCPVNSPGRVYEASIRIARSHLAAGLVSQPHLTGFGVPVLVGDFEVSVIAQHVSRQVGNQVPNNTIRRRSGRAGVVSYTARPLGIDLLDENGRVIARAPAVPFVFDTRLLQKYVPSSFEIDGIISFDDLFASFDLKESDGGLEIVAKAGSRGRFLHDHRPFIAG